MDPSINLDLQQLIKECQEDHKKYSEGDPKLKENDAARVKKLREIFKTGRIRTAQDLLFASYIFEYGLTLPDLEDGLKCSQKAVEMGLPPHESLVPQATDKLLVTKQTRIGIHKSLAKQHFGTQIALIMDGGKTVSFCPLDGTLTEQEIAIYGIPDCRKFEGKSIRDYLKATEEAKKAATQAWQSSRGGK